MRDRSGMVMDVSGDERSRALARFYDLDVLDVSYDAELYLQLAHEAGGAVLELAVGSGRLAVPLALAGHRVLGVDNDPSMLERARTAWERARGPIARRRLSLAEADIASFRTNERFRLAFIAVNTFLLAADDTARLALLATMREHLLPGGIAAVEVSTPDASELLGFDGRRRREWQRIDLETGHRVVKSIRARYLPGAGMVRLEQIFEWTTGGGGPPSRVTKEDTLHLLSAAELGALATEAGFDRVDLWGDHLSTPLGPGSHRVILVARLV